MRTLAREIHVICITVECVSRGVRYKTIFNMDIKLQRRHLGASILSPEKGLAPRVKTLE